jgi:hypothetical protein
MLDLWLAQPPRPGRIAAAGDRGGTTVLSRIHRHQNPYARGTRPGPATTREGSTIGPRSCSNISVDNISLGRGGRVLGSDNPVPGSGSTWSICRRRAWAIVPAQPREVFREVDEREDVEVLHRRAAARDRAERQLHRFVSPRMDPSYDVARPAPAAPRDLAVINLP